MGAAHAPWTEEDFELRSRGARIAARLYLPSGKGPHPALVIAHGSGEARRDRYEYLAAGLAARGWAFLSYDKRGVGGSEGTYSMIGPENSEAMFDLLADDVVAGIEHLARRDDIDARRIGVLGISQGGWIGPLAATKSRAVAFLVIVSGPVVSVGEEIFYSRLSGEQEGDGRLGSDGELTSKLAAFDGPHGFDPVPVLERLETPTLWILGDGDRSIPIPETVARLETLVGSGKPFAMRVLPGVGHGMSDVATGEPAPVVAIATEWLATLRPGR
jgi:dipeptidyl aminopeptidase/acylaminoacyl peptidase